MNQETPHINSLAFWENEGQMTFKTYKVDLKVIRCIKVNLTVTPEGSRSRRSVAEDKVKVTTGEDEILRGMLLKWGKKGLKMQLSIMFSAQ